MEEKYSIASLNIRSEDIEKGLEIVKQSVFDFKKLILTYESALKIVESKIEIISDEFNYLHKYNPIEHVKTRIKSPESIIKKMAKKNLPFDYDNLVENVNDIAGIRIICSFIQDIYTIVDTIKNDPDFEIINEKDYIKNPKESGYSSYHMIVTVPVKFIGGITRVKVEIQIRTIEMDFWASLEHKIRYKYNGDIPERVKKDLKMCGSIASQLDYKMSDLGKELLIDPIEG